MMTDIRAVLSRSSATLWQDLAGGAALMIMLVVGLHLPSLF